jgi:hypothetical protein
MLNCQIVTIICLPINDPITLAATATSIEVAVALATIE